MVTVSGDVVADNQLRVTSIDSSGEEALLDALEEWDTVHLRLQVVEATGIENGVQQEREAVNLTTTEDDPAGPTSGYELAHDETYLRSLREQELECTSHADWKDGLFHLESPEGVFGHVDSVYRERHGPLDVVTGELEYSGFWAEIDEIQGPDETTKWTAEETSGTRTSADAEDSSGNESETECPECGNPLAGDEKFCPECGHALSS